MNYPGESSSDAAVVRLFKNLLINIRVYITPIQ